MTTTILPATTRHLKALSGPKDKLKLKATDGQRTFVSVGEKLFTGFFDPDFENYSTNVSGKPSGEIVPVVYEMTQDGDFRGILAPFDESFWSNQDQPLMFVEQYPEWLHPEGWATFFPFIVGKKVFVASVYRYERKLEANVNHFRYDRVWRARYRRRFVLPQPVTP